MAEIAEPDELPDGRPRVHRHRRARRHPSRRVHARPPLPGRRQPRHRQDDAGPPVPARRRPPRRAGALRHALRDQAASCCRVGRSHGWSLDGIDIHEMEASEESLCAGLAAHDVPPVGARAERDDEDACCDEVEKHKPKRVVFDSLSEMRLLAQNPLRYRRQILALKQFFAGRESTVLLLDDRTAPGDDLQLQSIAHGVIRLEQLATELRRRAAAADRLQDARRRVPRRAPRLRHPPRRAGRLPPAGRRRAPR